MEKTEEWTISRKYHDKRARGLGRKTREETGNGNQMIALRLQTGWIYQTSLASERDREICDHKTCVPATWKVQRGIKDKI